MSNPSFPHKAEQIFLSMCLFLTLYSITLICLSVPALFSFNYYSSTTCFATWLGNLLLFSQDILVRHFLFRWIIESAYQAKNDVSVLYAYVHLYACKHLNVRVYMLLGLYTETLEAETEHQQQIHLVPRS